FELFLSQPAPSEEANQLAGLTDDGHCANTIVVKQFIDAFNRGMLRNEERRVHRSHDFTGPQAAPTLARNFFEIFEREDSQQPALMRYRKAGKAMQREDFIDKPVNR